MDRLEALEKLSLIKATNKLFQYTPYGWQIEFHKMGASMPERMLCAANRVGKTYCAAREVAYHATGLYPEWWDGKKFDSPVLVWAGGVTNEALRDIVQKELLGGLGDDLGTGALPKDLIAQPSRRQCGIGDVVDQVKIRHTKGWSLIVFKSYEQGWKKWQGTAPHVVWLDEEPEEYKIYTECRTRILTSHGIILLTFTPLSGLTQLVQHFWEEKPGTYVKNVTWDDVDHLSSEDKEMLLASLPVYEREARSKGVPMKGQGRVYPFSEEEVVCSPFEIPDFYRQIIGIDFGVDHPAASVKIAHEPHEDILYVVRAHKSHNMDSMRHSSQIKAMGGDVNGDSIPVSWPHDGVNREKSSGLQLKDYYAKEGVSLLSKSARYKNDVGGAQNTEPVVMDIYQRIVTGRFKVFCTETQWLEEFRNYHRQDGKLVRRMDDIMAATNYAVMMLRYAAPKYTKHTRSTMPKGISSRP